MLYTVRELAERCEVDVDFIERLRTEAGQFHPAVTVKKLGEEPVEIYDSFDALMLLWVKAFVRHGWSFREAKQASEEIVDGYFEDADQERYLWEQETRPDEEGR